MSKQFLEELQSTLDELNGRDEREKQLLRQMAQALEIADNATLNEFRRITAEHDLRRARLFAEMADFAETQLSPQAIESTPSPKLPHEQNGTAYSLEDMRRIHR